MRRLGEDVTEVLDYVPSSFKVIRHVRPSSPAAAARPSCRRRCHRCPSSGDDPAPDCSPMCWSPSMAITCRSTGRRRSTPARASTSTARRWPTGSASRRRFSIPWSRPAQEVMASDELHADDTPVPVLAPGHGRTKTGRLWTYVRDEGRMARIGRRLPCSSTRPTARASIRKTTWRASGAFCTPTATPASTTSSRDREVTEAACWAHVRRKFFDVHAASGAPLAEEALNRIGALYGVEEHNPRQPPDERRRCREEDALPLVAAFRDWLEATLPKLSAKTELAAAIRYALGRWAALTRYLDDGRIEIDNNAAERAIRGVALGRKNYLFAGSDTGGERAAAIYTLIETAKLNGLDPEAWLRSVLTRQVLCRAV